MTTDIKRTELVRSADSRTRCSTARVHKPSCAGTAIPGEKLSDDRETQND